MWVTHCNALIRLTTVTLQAQLGKLSSVVGEIVKVGGAGYKVIMLLEGKADCYLYPR